MYIDGHGLTAFAVVALSTGGCGPAAGSRADAGLVTSKGVTLGSTLAGLRAAYGHVRFVGTSRSASPDGLVFYDNAKNSPSPPSSRIVEIKIGTCGDF